MRYSWVSSSSEEETASPLNRERFRWGSQCFQVLKATTDCRTSFTAYSSTGSNFGELTLHSKWRICDRNCLLSSQKLWNAIEGSTDDNRSNASESSCDGLLSTGAYTTSLITIRFSCSLTSMEAERTRPSSCECSRRGSDCPTSDCRWDWSGLRTRWDEIILSMIKIPSDEVLESLYKLRTRESDQLSTVFELHDMEIHQKISISNYQKLKTMVKRSIVTRLWRQAREYETGSVV